MQKNSSVAARFGAALLTGGLFLTACGAAPTTTNVAPTAAAAATSVAVAAPTVMAEVAPTAAAAATSVSAAASNPTVVAAATAAMGKINLNTATPEQLMAAIPGMGDQMLREFSEYRPYVSIEQFRKEMGKYVDAQQIAMYEQYVYVPIDMNAADAATLQQIPGLDAAGAQALMAARPFADNQAFLNALQPYVPAEALAAAQAYIQQ